MRSLPAHRFVPRDGGAPQSPDARYPESAILCRRRVATRMRMRCRGQTGPIDVLNSRLCAAHMGTSPLPNLHTIQ